MNRKSILIVIFCVLTLITIVELVYYSYYKLSEKPLFTLPGSSLNSESNNIKLANPNISDEDLKNILNPNYQKFIPLGYDKNIDRFFIDIPAEKYIEMRRGMALNYVSWTKYFTYRKNSVDLMAMTYRLKEQITEFRISENILQKTKLFKIVDGKEIPARIDEFKKDDKIIREETVDLTKNPGDINYYIQGKIIKL